MTLRGLGLLALALAACARAFPPPGGDPIQSPPQVVGTTPEPLSLVDGFEGPVVFNFSRTLSERGVSDASVLVSPRTGAERVKRSGTRLEVQLEGGWHPGIVYRVVLLPGLRDRFGNETREPAELVFSTGPELPTAAIGGMVLDRITGRAANNVVVAARSRVDTLTYLTVPDTAAFFAFGHLAPGSYDMSAFVDQNRNRTQDDREARAAGVVLTVNRATDTLTTVLEIVPADTTSPRIERAEARDSLQIRVFTDDYLEPEAPLDLVQVSLFVLPDTVPVEGTVSAMTVARYDSLRAAADTTRAQRPQLPPGVGPARPGARPGAGLPAQEFVVVPTVPLEPGGRYQLRVEGLTNISGRSGGGGNATFEVPRRPAPRDTTATPVQSGLPTRPGRPSR